MIFVKRLFLAALAAAFLLAPGAASADTPAWRDITYGGEPPTLVCNPLSACLVALQPGEVVTSRYLADTANWEIEVGSTTGNGVPLIAIKPHVCNRSSNLYVATDRRVYSFVLDSPVCDAPTLKAASVPITRFTYPEDFGRTWGEQPPAKATPGIQLQASNPANLNFDYSVSAGRHAIKPDQVYDDGQRIYVVLSSSDRNGPAPAVFVLGEKNKLEAINFQPPSAGGNTYIVDRLVPQLVLVSGPDKNQRTEIRRKGAR